MDILRKLTLYALILPLAMPITPALAEDAAPLTVEEAEVFTDAAEPEVIDAEAVSGAAEDIVEEITFDLGAPEDGDAIQEAYNGLIILDEDGAEALPEDEDAEALDTTEAEALEEQLNLEGDTMTAYDLRDLIAMAAEGGTVTLSQDVRWESREVHPLIIDHSITLDLNGHCFIRRRCYAVHSGNADFILPDAHGRPARRPARARPRRDRPHGGGR